jgi:tRNA(Ile)-lysidine synthase
MLRVFQEYITETIRLPSDSKTLLAISGGMDSMVMLHLFHAAGLNCGVAHCNFQLRNEDADADAVLVEQIAQNLNLPFYSIRFDTRQIAENEGISIQMAARNLRYEWLEKIRSEKGYDYIATAHHLNDSIETLVYNLTKGCGVRGLHGIPVINKYIIRPLSFATRAEIMTCQQIHDIAFREDASNTSTKYSRNLIRLELLPILRKINPALEHTMADNFQRFRELEYLFDFAVKSISQKAVSDVNDRVEVDIRLLRQHEPALPTLLFECLNTFGINTSQVNQLTEAIKAGRIGAEFLTPTHRLLLDRTKILIEEKVVYAPHTSYIMDAQKEGQIQLPDGLLSASLFEGRPHQFSSDPFLAYLDADELMFPIHIRHWQAGDSFQPLGMNGHHQKVQDFFSNNKLSKLDKAKVWIVEDAYGRICWLAGYRLDDRFRIKPDTKRFWTLNFVKV